MRTNQQVVFDVWCRLTGHEPGELTDTQRAEFFGCDQVPELAATPYSTLLEAGISAASRGSLPMQEWLGDVRARQGISA